VHFSLSLTLSKSFIYPSSTLQKRGSAQKEPLLEDQENKLNPHSSKKTHPHKNFKDQEEATSPVLVNTAATIPAGSGTTYKHDINFDDHPYHLSQQQEIKNRKPSDIKKKNLPGHSHSHQKQKRRQQRHVDPQLFQGNYSHDAVIVRKKRTRQEADDDSDAVCDDPDFHPGAGAGAAAEGKEKDKEYHPVVGKRRLFLKKQKPKQQENQEKQQQQQEMDYPGVAGASTAKRARRVRKASAASASAAAAVVKKQKNGDKKLGKKAADATSNGAEDAQEMPPPPSLPCPPPVSELLPATAASVVAAAAMQGQPLSLEAQVKALLIHTSAIEERICQKDSEIASLNGVVAALRQTVMTQQNITSNGAADAGSAAAKSQNPSLSLPPPIHGEVQIVQSLEKMGANISSCASNLNHHSKQIQAIISQLNTANTNTNHIFSVMRQLREGICNLEHHSMTHAAGVAGCQAEIARLDEFLKEYKKDIKKKVEDFAKVADGVRPSWDVSPQAAPAAHLF
jgi:hypothetical protein